MNDPFDAAETTTPAPVPRPPARETPPPRPPDHSREIEQAVARQPRDRVKCAHLFGPYYRCNWWASNASGSPRDPSPVWAQHVYAHVRKSRFLSAVVTGGKLRITEMPG